MADDHDKLRDRIAALRTKTVANGCTEQEALSAAAKVAELLDRHALSLTDIELRSSACQQLVYAPRRNKRIPLDACMASISRFCDCRVWREKDAAGVATFVFYGLPDDIAAARDLAEVVDTAVRTELGRFKTSRDYLRVDHKQRHLMNGSFALGMVTSIAEALDAMKDQRDQRHRGSGRDLAVVKTSAVDEALAKLGFELRPLASPRRWIAPGAFEAGNAAGSSFDLDRPRG